MWQRLDETPYLINVYPEERFANSSPPLPSSSMGFDDMEDQMMLSSDEEDEEDDDDLEVESDTNTTDGRIPDLMLSEGGSPTSQPVLEDIDWGEVDDELADFMGSEADDTDLDSRNGNEGYDSGCDSDTITADGPIKNPLTANNDSLQVAPGNKRDRSTTPPHDSDDDSKKLVDTNPSLLKSPLSKRVRLSNSRTSSLRNLTLSADDPSVGESGIPSPAHSQSEKGDKDGSSKGGNDEDDFDLDAEFANEFN